MSDPAPDAPAPWGGAVTAEAERTPVPPLPPPGWYADPSDDFEVRWWSGSVWTDHVSTQGYTGLSPLVLDPVPAEETTVWWGPEPRIRFTTERAYLLHPGPDGWQELVVPWRAVRAAWWQPTAHTTSPTPSPAGPLVHVGLQLDQAGLPDQVWIPALPDGARVAAVARMWARRHQR
ncbi:hypothetical protein J2S59_001144 [Nocardioides massiliensis]|uniref:DUF2510 domain-containing protein n=2 Tax=Nocardioides massiliensis TaxID=1325935 RepID=A0ABT9NLM9_9ACTN|nr:DUF2510 domain-containing protein [Nocardioides massiliensis]MDP9821335.1 hypothetical protein [Nocardioides massiliensis]